MKAITTKYHGPTERRGSRISASDSDGNKVTLPYDHSLNSDDNHRKAADALMAKMDWAKNTVLHGGYVKHGMVWVMTFAERCRHKLRGSDGRTRRCRGTVGHPGYCHTD